MQRRPRCVGIKRNGQPCSYSASFPSEGSLYCGYHYPKKKRRRHKRHSYCVGENNPQAKLVEHQVREIRRLYSLGVAQLDLAAAYGVSPRAIRFLLSRETWKHI